MEPSSALISGPRKPIQSAKLRPYRIPSKFFYPSEKHNFAPIAKKIMFSTFRRENTITKIPKKLNISLKISETWVYSLVSYIFASKGSWQRNEIYLKARFLIVPSEVISTINTSCKGS